MKNEAKDSIASYLSRVMNSEGAAAPKTRVRVAIAGEEYTIVAAETEEYIRRIAALVDEKVRGIMESGRVPLADAVVLAACNLADEKTRAAETAESLRSQIKAYSDEIARLRTELSAMRREAAARALEQD